jgi:tellurite resistance protein
MKPTPVPSPISEPAPSFGWLPVGLFGSVMGLTGLSADWRLAHALWGVPMGVAHAVGAVAVVVFVALLIAYGVKAGSDFSSVCAEFAHPVTGALFGLPLISALLLPGVLADVGLAPARGLWIVAAIGMTVFAWTMTARWLGGGQQRVHASPAWIVPLVGMLDIPLAVPALGFAEPPYAVMMLGLAVGLFFAVPLFTVIMARLMFEEPMPEAMLPSLFILLAPFSVGFTAYVIVVGRVDALAEALFALTLFLLVALLVRLRQLPRCCPFRVSWWAVSFPLAASASAALRYARFAPSTWAGAIAAVILALASVVIVYLLIRTITGILRGELQRLGG